MLTFRQLTETLPENCTATLGGFGPSGRMTERTFWSGNGCCGNGRLP
jgi:hypothetical protein